jgi:hypothetical protein
VLACGYVTLEYPGIRPLFATEPDEEGERWMNSFAEFIAENTTYEDIVFGSEFYIAIDTRSPYLPISMKRVYPVQSIPEMFEQIGSLETEYVVCIVCPLRRKPGSETPVDQLLRQYAYEQKKSPNLIMYKIHKQDFLKIVEKSSLPITRDPNLPEDGAS